jgi:hypothetical protein
VVGTRPQRWTTVCGTYEGGCKSRRDCQYGIRGKYGREGKSSRVGKKRRNGTGMICTVWREIRE